MMNEYEYFSKLLDQPGNIQIKPKLKVSQELTIKNKPQLVAKSVEKQTSIIKKVTIDQPEKVKNKQEKSSKPFPKTIPLNGNPNCQPSHSQVRIDSLKNSDPSTISKPENQTARKQIIPHELKRRSKTNSPKQQIEKKQSQSTVQDRQQTIKGGIIMKRRQLNEQGQETNKIPQKTHIQSNKPSLQSKKESQVHETKIFIRSTQETDEEKKLRLLLDGANKKPQKTHKEKKVEKVKLKQVIKSPPKTQQITSMKVQTIRQPNVDKPPIKKNQPTKVLTKSDDEYDLNDSFIDDGKNDLEDSFEQREYLETIGKIRKRLVCSKGEDDGDIPEDDFEEMQKQERQSRYIGKIIDNKELQFIQAEEEHDAKKKIKRN